VRSWPELTAARAPTQAMADAMRGVTKAMGTMNKQLNLPQLTNIMRQFERQNERCESRYSTPPAAPGVSGPSSPAPGWR
jgi:hypothetical protein